MNKRLKQAVRFGLILMLGVSMSACSDSWKEEVLLHDGRKTIVARSQSYGGRHEVGQSSPVKEHIIEFSLPHTNQKLRWVSEYSEDVGRANFNLLALHVLGDTPYLVVEPNLCLSYNKWGRPNPPYVFFKYDGRTWQRIPLSAFPRELQTINLIVNNSRLNDIEESMKINGHVSSEDVQKINGSLKQPEYQTILRNKGVRVEWH